MDIFIHVIIGLAVASSFFYKKLGNNSFFYGAIFSIFPDLDYLFALLCPYGYGLVIRQSLMHSLLTFPFFSLTFSWLIWRYRLKKKKIPYDLFCIMGMLVWFSHILIDWSTAYGVAWFWPLSFQYYFLDLLPLFDQIFILPALVFLYLAFYKQNSKWSVGLLGLFFLYLLLAILQRHLVKIEQQKLVLARGQNLVKSRVFPQTSSLFIWRSLYRTEDTAFVDKITLYPFFYPRIDKGEKIKLASFDKIVTTYLNEEIFKKHYNYFENYVDGFIAFIPPTDSKIQEIYDLRFSDAADKFDIKLKMKFDPSLASKSVKIEY